MLQKGVRSLPKLSRDIVNTSAAIRAVSTDSPSYASIASPFTRMLTGAGLATPTLIRLLTVAPLVRAAQARCRTIEATRPLHVAVWNGASHDVQADVEAAAVMPLVHVTPTP
jgi:hypothetical protein